MNGNIDFSKMSNADISMKMRGYDNEYQVKKQKIINLIGELEQLDKIYISAKKELEKRGVLKDE